MELLQDIWQFLDLKIVSLIVLATFHGYAAAWLAVRMLFRPRRPVKLFGYTVFPQGMIPRHRSRIAGAIGRAVGEELMSQETVLEELFEKEFLKNKIQSVIDSFGADLISKSHPSIVEILPENMRIPVLESVAKLQSSIGKYVEKTIQNEETSRSIEEFVGNRVDEVLSQNVSDVFTDETYSEILLFVHEKIASVLEAPALDSTIRGFVSKRVDDLANTTTPLSEMLTSDAVSLLKEKATEQIEPIIHQLSELATEDRTKDQISTIIKKEVHSYYEQLPFVKKIFVSRETLLKEVDNLVDESLPKRIEETLKGDFFAVEAKRFVKQALDISLARPIPELIGQIAPTQLDGLKERIGDGILSVLRGNEMRKSISAYVSDSLENLRPRKIGSLLISLHSEAGERIKETLSNGMLKTLANEDTSKIIHEVLTKQIDALIHKPIGNISGHISKNQLDSWSESITNAIISTAKAKLPEVIKEFDVGSVVRDKVNNYEPEKLEALILSIAKEHLRTIELIGGVIGFLLGIGQAFQFYIYR